MLVLTRKFGEEIVMKCLGAGQDEATPEDQWTGEMIVVRLLSIDPNKVRIGVIASMKVKILRSELLWSSERLHREYRHMLGTPPPGPDRS